MRTACVVVGAGPAGLAVSTALVASGVEHVVLERADVADTWRNQRWDSFRLNTPAWMNAVLGGVGPHAFCFRDEVVQLLTDESARLPVRTRTPVLAVEPDGAQFLVRTPEGRIEAATVVVASGLLNVPRTPALAQALPPRLVQLHGAEYRSPDRLPEGTVLVVGSAQSGCQIAEDLALAGRRVLLSTSRVGRLPWGYRGGELFAWLRDCGYWDQRPQDLEDPSVTRMATPVIASGGRSLDLRMLAAAGVTLLGRLQGVQGERLTFDGSVADTVAFADRVAAMHYALADDYIATHSVPAPGADPDQGGAAFEPGAAVELDLAAENVGSVVWCTGFTGDLSWLRLPVLDSAGRPLHEGCASPVPGVWFAGFPWLTRRRSGILYGFPVDADEVAAGVTAHLRR